MIFLGSLPARLSKEKCRLHTWNGEDLNKGRDAVVIFYDKETRVGFLYAFYSIKQGARCRA